MAKQFEALDPTLKDFIERQKIFFTASATDRSRINVSPRETGALRIVDDNTVVYLDQTGSGNETAAHLLADGRLTFLFCAFEGPPRILRLYGTGRSIGWKTDEFRHLIATHYDGDQPLGARKIVELRIDLAQTSCGFGVPMFDYVGERETLKKWADSKGRDGIEDYWAESNLESMDGLPTGLELP